MAQAITAVSIPEIGPKNLVITAKNTVICPLCSQEIGLGPSGIENFKKRHLGSANCKKVQAKRDAKERSKSVSLYAFFQRKEKVPPSSIRVDTASRLATGCATKKRTASRLEDLQTCLCGEAADGGTEPSIACRFTGAGCETGRYHLNCIELDSSRQNWICPSCQGRKTS